MSRVLYILWLRQIKKYLRSRSRIIGAIGQPVLFLLALGYGLGSVFKQAGQGNYLEFLVPGIVIQTLLFASIFWGVNVIFDRLFGFLKETLVAPVPRVVTFLGSVLGGATTAFAQGCIVLVLSLALGFRPHDWALFPVALLLMALLAIAITSLGGALGAIIDNMAGFQAINNFLIFPLYFLSGAIYPLNHAPRVLQIVSECNPLAYAVDGLRSVLIGQSHLGLVKDLIVMAITVIVLVAFGVNRFRNIQV